MNTPEDFERIRAQLHAVVNEHAAEDRREMWHAVMDRAVDGVLRDLEKGEGWD